MFTGIIEEIGTIANIQYSGESFMLTIDAKKVLTDVQVGDSIAVNGVCLTVTSYTENRFTVDVMPETVKASSLKTARRGSKVNLERAMAAGGRFGGHFVAGHVDGVGIIKGKTQVENAVYYEIQVEPDLLKYVILKGSVAVDGTSLTVFGISEDSLTLSLIPLTLADTVLGFKDKGDIVNIECDMIGKYVGHFLSDQLAAAPKRESKITARFLEDNGFM
ncbi:MULTISPECIES: riboflavin synthase [Mesobacillus]|uniref:Riboflavin synthase n=2 Tax=Mesobacillus TaxID=2675231 RepID=A0A0D6Z8D7_9BACI|nr:MULTISPECIES: riboflavin synthase [Mesobacillus]KIY20838.1 riboflavin synthase subunit alpha [Mesobacillus subterraneus]MDQ0412844.1 riboflavin synthase [Mesobacillus stamsii]